MILILLVLAAVGLGYVLALAYWGALAVLRPALDVFKTQRQSEVEARPVTTVARPIVKVYETKLLRQQLYPLKPSLRVEPKYVMFGAGSGKTLAYTMLAHPDLAKKNVLVCSTGNDLVSQPANRRLLITNRRWHAYAVRLQGADLPSLPKSELRRHRCTVMLSEAAAVLQAPHHGRELYELQRQKQALVEPRFASQQKTIAWRDDVALRVSDDDLHTPFPIELAPAWR